MDKIHEVYFDLVRNNYTAYCQYVHEGRWLVSKHLKYICDRVQSFIGTDTNHAYDILLVQVPPQHGKSLTITETLPSFYHGRYPEKRIIMASYNDETAERFTRRNKEKIKIYGKSLFGIEIGDIDRATEYEIANHQGRLISRGIMGGITSNPADLILIDDPIKNRQEADSDTFRNRLWDEWQNTFKTRLAAGAKIIVIMTRWHEDDLAGRIIKYENHVEILNLPCEAEENDILGRKVGEALFPEIGKGNEWLAEFKAGYQTKEGNRAWLALFQGRPTADSGNLINRNWWKFYVEVPEMIQEIMSVDATFKGNDNNDFVSIQVWGKRNADMYLLDKDKRHLDFPQTMAAIRQMKTRHPNVSLILIEDKANGSAIISMLQHEIPGIIPINPDGGKVARVNAVSHVIESGNTYLPQDAEWLNEFIEECSAFPNGVHDDDVDAMSQALNRFIYFGADIPEIEQPDIYAAFGTEEKSEGLFSGTVTEEYLTGGW
jgi:predicted phage terminase large subunit-like protein